MTPEERAAIESERIQLEAERSRLYAAIAAAQRRQEALKEDLQFCTEQMVMLEESARQMHGVVHADMTALSSTLEQRSLDVRDLRQALDDVSQRYFSYKNLSTATKNLTQFNDEYYTRFRFYHELRRISLGCVMAVDINLINQERARTSVEKAYLENTEYWLAYAAMAVMLWWSDEHEACGRAISRALQMNDRKSALMFLFCCLKFGRKTAALDWYEYYLGKTQANNVGQEFQYLIDASLSGAFGNARLLQSKVSARIDAMFDEIAVSDPGYMSGVARAAADDLAAQAHVSRFDFFYLPVYCAQYQKQRDLINNAEKIALTAHDLQDVAATEPRTADVAEKLEDAIYNVIDSMDDDELALYRNIRYNEMVVGARGDLQLARRAYDERYPDDERVTFGGLLTKWAFSDGDVTVLPQTRRFAITKLKAGIADGYKTFVDGLKHAEHERYTITVDDWSMDCNESEGDSAKAAYTEAFNKGRFKRYCTDRLALIFMLLVVAGVVGLVVCACAWRQWAPVVVFTLLLLGGAFALWMRVRNLHEQDERRRLKSLQIIDRTLQELGQWRTAFHEALGGESLLDEAFAQFDD